MGVTLRQHRRQAAKCTVNKCLSLLTKMIVLTKLFLYDVAILENKIAHNGNL